MSRLKDKPCFLALSDYPDDFSPCHRRVLSARSISPQQLKKSLNQLVPVSQLTYATEVAERLYQAVCAKEKIVIVGDYDADGATAMSVMLTVLRLLEANVDSVVPNRVTMGYGLSAAAVEQVLAKSADVVVTVDNGISAVQSVEQLKARGLCVIITDHHLAPEKLPPADWIVNPNQPNCDFPDTALAGVGVAFYVMLALLQVAKQRGVNSAVTKRITEFDSRDLLPYVAIGTIADCVPLSLNNRILIEQGLKKLRAGQGSEGIKALLNVAGIDSPHVCATDIAFQVAPRLNAAGRIADMQLGVDCLMTQNGHLAHDYAIELDRLNRERKAIENEMRAEADLLIAEQTNLENSTAQHSFCLFEPHWNEGVIGILASRIKEKYQKTSVIFSQNGEVLKGSARATDAVNVVAALDAVHRLSPTLMHGYGGHAKAAGLTLAKEQLENFSHLFEQQIRRQVLDNPADECILTDGALLPYEMNVDNAEFMRLLEPWGASMPEPLFNNEFYIDSIKEVGKNHAQMGLIGSSCGTHFKGIAFDKYQDYRKLVQQRCRVAYHLSVNHWRGQRQLALQVTYIENI